jgi:Rps23 Pro-64 3,4-dihydroxylase Tpa1-like proline 4-hydroxylase
MTVNVNTSQLKVFPVPDLMTRAQKMRLSYQEARPFPCIVADGFFEPEILSQVLEEFPKPNPQTWITHNTNREKKYGTHNKRVMGQSTRFLLSKLCEKPFIDFLECLTGIEDLIPDPSLLGGGLHQIERGGFLKIHADFNYHARLKAYRRLNLLVFLNPEWHETYGGYLELWNSKMTQCEKRIAPTFNRMIIFNTSDTSFHGHPDPLTCPTHFTRKSLALYYYTKEHPGVEPPLSHSTLWQKRPD